MSRFITVIYDTERWDKNELEDIYNLPSTTMIYFGDAIKERDTAENELEHLKEICNENASH